MKDRFVAKRAINIAIMFFVTFVSTSAICLFHDLWIDEIAGVILTDVIFFLLFVYILENNRLKRLISGNRETDFRKVRIGYSVAALILLSGSFFPEFLKPAILIPMLMMACSSQMIAFSTGIFYNMMLCLILGLGVQELVLYSLMTLFGCILAEAMETERFQKWCYLIILCLFTAMPAVFYYLTYQEIKKSLLLYGAIEGIIVNVILLFGYKKIGEIRDLEVPDLLDQMLDDGYPMVRELSEFSKAEYNHARRVSATAKKCAGIVSADEKVCATAGFYYRIGIIDGELIVRSGIHIAQKHCFPESVLRIISEYNGEETLPSTVESAIVHMADGLIKKLEVLDKQQTMASEWNQDMVIYQTLNEFSANGLYDKSGLSMNMFLKIREYLVKEEALL